MQLHDSNDKNCASEAKKKLRVSELLGYCIKVMGQARNLSLSLQMTKISYRMAQNVFFAENAVIWKHIEVHDCVGKSTKCSEHKITAEGMMQTPTTSFLQEMGVLLFRYTKSCFSPTWQHPRSRSHQQSLSLLIRVATTQSHG